MVTCGVSPTARRTGQGALDCPVHHRTVQCAAKSSSFSPMASFVGAINTPPIGHSKVWESKQHTRHIVDISKCSYAQVLNRITR
jgi:hypothetical protein